MERPQTQAAISAAQKSLGLPITGVPSDALLTKLNASKVSAPTDGSLNDRSISSLQSLANGGSANAQFELGSRYYNGQGVRQDNVEAARLYRLAALQGHVWARFNLAVMYETGVGVGKSYSEAARWYRLAASQGHTPSQRNLESLQRDGYVPR